VLLLVRDKVGGGCSGDIRCDNRNAGLGALGGPGASTNEERLYGNCVITEGCYCIYSLNFRPQGGKEVHQGDPDCDKFCISPPSVISAGGASGTIATLPRHLVTPLYP